MIPYAKNTVPPVLIIIFTSNCYIYSEILKSGDGRMDDICKIVIITGRMDQLTNLTQSVMIEKCSNNYL